MNGLLDVMGQRGVLGIGKIFNAEEFLCQAIEDAKAKLAAGTLHVFDVTTFTVGGAAISDSQMADVDTDAAYTPDTDVVDGGYYHESEFRSAPYFDLSIDGITRLDKQD